MLLLGGRVRILIPKLSGSGMFAPNYCSILLVAETRWKERSSGSQMGLCWVLAPIQLPYLHYYTLHFRDLCGHCPWDQLCDFHSV